MSAPEVTNLAAKIIGLDPKLTPVQVKAKIIAGSDPSVVNGKTILLIDPAKTLMALLESEARPLREKHVTRGG